MAVLISGFQYTEKNQIKYKMAKFISFIGGRRLADGNYFTKFPHIPPREQFEAVSQDYKHYDRHLSIWITSCCPLNGSPNKQSMFSTPISYTTLESSPYLSSTFSSLIRKLCENVALKLTF